MIRVTHILANGDIARDSFADAAEYNAKQYDNGDTFIVLLDAQNRIVASFDPTKIVGILSGAAA